MQSTYYHIYNRGAHKAPVFNDTLDYWRMLELLYIANNTEHFEIKALKKKHPDIFSVEKKGTLVDIAYYCLMPNHFHIVLKPTDVKHPSEAEVKHPFSAISRFIQKLCTGYTNYYNRKYYDHSGTIWQGSFNEKEVCDEDYLKTLFTYVHLNPYKIKQPHLTREARAEHLAEAIEYCKNYEYSSFKDYLGEKRPQTAILSATELKRWQTEVKHPSSHLPS